MKRVEREQKALLREHGVTIEEETRTKHGHIKCRCLGPQGQRFIFVLVQTAGGPRKLKNMEADLKKCLTGLKAETTLSSL